MAQQDQLIRLIVDANQAVRELERTRKATESISGTFDKLGSVIRGFGGGLAASLSLGALIAGFKSSANAMDEMVKAAQKVGTTTEKLSALSYAAKQSGVSFEGLQTGLKQLNKNMADVDKGTTDAAKALRALGVKGGDSPEAALAKISDAFAGSADGAGKTAVAMAVFGKAGADLIPMLNAGASGLEAFKTRAEQLGIIIDTQTAKQAEVFNDSLSDMQTAMGGIVTNITAGMLPAMSGLAAAFAESARAGDEWKEVGRSIGETFINVTEVALRLGDQLSRLLNLVVAFSAAQSQLMQGNLKNAILILADYQTRYEEASAGTERTIAAMRKAIADLGKEDANAGVSVMARKLRELDDQLHRGEITFETWAEGVRKATGSMGLLAGAARSLGTEAKSGGMSEFQKLLQSLNDELVKLEMTGTGSMTKVIELQALIATGSLKLSEGERATALALAERIDKEKALIEALKERIAAQKEQAAAAMAEIEAEQNALTARWNEAKALERSLDPLRAYTHEMEKLMELKNFMDPELFSAAMDKIRQKMEDAQKTTAETNDQFQYLKDAIDGYGKQMAGAFVDAIAEGENFGDSFKKITASVLKNLAQLILQKQVFDKMFASFSSGGGGGGFFSNIFASLFNANGNAFSKSTGLPFGVYNQPTPFAMPGGGPLKAFASGGILGEAGPEAIMPLRRTSSGRLGVEASGAAVNVNVINNAGASVDVRQDGDNIDIIINKVRSALTRDVRSGGNAFAGALQGTYGLNRGAA